MFLHVASVRYLQEYRIRLEFSDGVVKDVNLEGELHGPVFEPLKDPTTFRQVRLNPDSGTIEWPNGADLAPEFLYEAGTLVKQTA